MATACFMECRVIMPGYKYGGGHVLNFYYMLHSTLISKPICVFTQLKYEKT